MGEAIRDFGISKRTLERRIADGTISQSQIFVEDGKRHIPIVELIRAFGEPRNRPETEAAGGQAPAPAPTAGDVTGGAEMVALLKDQLAKAEALANAERDRADRYEAERDELRVKYEEVLTRLLPPPAPAPAAKRPGWFGRLLGR